MACKLHNNTFCSIFLFSMSSIFCGQAVAQNLVKNPGFEEYDQCPKDTGMLSEYSFSWSNATQGKSDYFNQCSDKMAVNHNFIGQQDAFEGNAYAGIYVYAANDYREYISGELKQKLKKGKKYNFSFRVSLADKSEYAIKEFGALFTSTKLDLYTKRNVPSNIVSTNGIHNYVPLNDHTYHKEKDDWVELKGEYLANGTEQFIVIGNFKDNKRSKHVKVGSNLKKVAYYYIDDVAVEEAEQQFDLEEIYVLENLLFKEKGYTIEGRGKLQLESLIAHLKDNPSLHVSIFGHTDSEGSERFNRDLSHNRAMTIGLNLVENGLSADRITWVGLGDNNPLVKNHTKAGRDKNHRVEFILSNKKITKGAYAAGVFEDDK